MRRFTPRILTNCFAPLTTRRANESSVHAVPSIMTAPLELPSTSMLGMSSSSKIATRVDVGARCTLWDMVSAGKSSSVTIRKSSSTITTRSAGATGSTSGTFVGDVGFAVALVMGTMVASRVTSRVASRPNASRSSSSTSSDTSEWKTYQKLVRDEW